MPTYTTRKFEARQEMQTPTSRHIGTWGHAAVMGDDRVCARAWRGDATRGVPIHRDAAPENQKVLTSAWTPWRGARAWISRFTELGIVKQRDHQHPQQCHNRKYIKCVDGKKVHSDLCMAHCPDKYGGGHSTNHQIGKNQRVDGHSEGVIFDDNARANKRQTTAAREPLANTPVVTITIPTGTKYPTTVDAIRIFDKSAKYRESSSIWLLFSRIFLFYLKYSDAVKNHISYRRTFSSMRNFSMERSGKGDVSFANRGGFCGKHQSGADGFSGKLGVCFYDPLGCLSGGQHLQNEMNHNTSPFETGLSVAYIRINGDIIIDAHRNSISLYK